MFDEGCWRQPNSGKIKIMEAFAFRDGVKMAVNLGKQVVIVESDCQVLSRLWEERLPLC